MIHRAFLSFAFIALSACACSTSVEGQGDDATQSMEPNTECPMGSAECPCDEDNTCYGGLACSAGRCIQVELGFTPPGAGGARTNEEPCDGDDQGVHVVGQNTGLCYRYVNTRVPWTVARENCQDWGGELVTVRSLRQQTELTALFRSESDDITTEVWLGLSSREGSWQWASGEDVGYTSWSNTEPDQESESECGYAFARSEYDWHDQDCTEAYFFVCER